MKIREQGTVSLACDLMAWWCGGARTGTAPLPAVCLMRTAALQQGLGCLLWKVSQRGARWPLKRHQSFKSGLLTVSGPIKRHEILLTIVNV